MKLLLFDDEQPILTKKGHKGVSARTKTSIETRVSCTVAPYSRYISAQVFAPSVWLVVQLQWKPSQRTEQGELSATTADLLGCGRFR